MGNESNQSAAYARKTLSKKNPYHISKHRYYELKHFCLQYHEWTDDANKTLIYEALDNVDDWAKTAIFKAVTEGLGYTYVSMILAVPCCKDTYYKEYRKFFYMLSMIKK